MIKIKLLGSLALLGIFSSSLWAQKQYNEQDNYLMANRVWAFGKYAGLDFNSGKPVPIQTGATSLEGTASACDPQTGALLFYVVKGGEQVYNRNHQLMTHGDSLGFGSGYYSTAQTCIVPVIDSPGVYYVFVLPWGGNGPVGLHYSIVDMSLNNGLGDVRPGQKRIELIPGPISEAMVAIPGNNCDIWLMTHKYNKPEFIAFHITKDGIDPNYVLSAPPGPDTMATYPETIMQVSPNRERIYITAHRNQIGSIKQCLLYKFDPTTGKVYEPLIMENPKKSGPLGGIISAAFSPDNSKLYLTTLDFIRQFDISIYDPIAIDTSVYLFGKSGGGPASNYGLRLYGDTIYVGSGRGPNQTYISTISHPNLKGAACGFVAASINLLSGTLSDLGMCAEIVYPLKGASVRSLALDTILCSDQFNLDLVAPNGYNYYYWQDGYVGAQRQINNPGTYWVKANMLGGEGHDQDCDNRVDTFIVRSGNFIPPVITVNVFELSTTLPYDAYQWYFNGAKIPGATQQKLQVSQNGNYTVSVSNENGCQGLSEIYKVTNVGINSIAYATTIEVYPNPARDILYVNSHILLDLHLYSIEGKLIREAANANSMSTNGLAPGMYLLHLTDKEGRSVKKVKIIKCD